MPNYRTCTHTDDSGRTCKSAAAKGRNFCGFHLRYRGRLLRMAQYRARHQRFDITLPPLDSLCSIQSALCQVAEALAADMIDPRRALGLLKALRFAKENLKDSLKDNANWHQSPYYTEDQASYDNFESDYGLPENLDISVPPEVSFPPPPDLQSVILSGGGAPLAPPQSKDPFVASPCVGGMGALPLSFAAANGGRGVFPDPPKPYVRDYMAEAEAAMQVQPEDIELMEIMKKYGYKAWDHRAKEHQRNERRRRQRKYFRANYDRFVAEANAKNIQNAAERLYQERVAAERAEAAKKPPAPAVEPAPEEARNTA